MKIQKGKKYTIKNGTLLVEIIELKEISENDILVNVNLIYPSGSPCEMGKQYRVNKSNISHWIEAMQ